jgi:trk system potassium uptake protein TrkH
MNWRLVLNLLGTLSILLAAAMLPSLGMASLGEEAETPGSPTSFAFLVGVLLCVGLGLALRATTTQGAEGHLGPAEGFAVAALGWCLMAVLGAVPMALCATGDAGGVSDRFGPAEAFFESMSGFTTTGSSVFGTPLHEGGIGRIEDLPPSFLFWRSLTHWLGGMGIVVLCLAILPALRAGGYQMFRAEVPGPTAERLRPRVRETAAILWGVYLLLTGAEALLLWAGEMPIFDALCHTFGTMATGGFSTKDASIGHYAQVGHPNALYFEAVICIFMFLAGTNFLLHYRALYGEPALYARDSEFRFYVCVLAAGTVVITAGILLSASAGSAGEALRHSVFQILSITTTTGFVTADFNAWPGGLRALLVVLMFFGGCAGSTGGGLKQVRILVALRFVYRELLRLLRPQLANRLRVGNVSLDERLLASILGLVLLYAFILVLATVLVLVCLGDAEPGTGLSEDGRLVTGTSAVVATLNNIGPGLSAVGATANYGWMPAAAKVLLSFCMLMGRLEVYAVLVVLLPMAWRR